jgi:hypothetical protein
MKNIYIYGLIDPRYPKIIRYVGKTKNKLNKRLTDHINEARRSKSNNYKLNWIRSLLFEKIKPIITILEAVTENNWQEKEKYWIHKYKNKNLTNTLEGGYSGGIYTVSILQYDLHGQFIKEFSSIEEACNKVKLKRGCITSALQRSGLGGVYQWRYKTDEIYPKNIGQHVTSRFTKVKLTDTIKNIEFYFDSIKELKHNFPIFKSNSRLLKCRNNNLLYKKRFKIEDIV